MSILKKFDHGLCVCEDFFSAMAMFVMCIIVFVAVVLRWFDIPWPISDEIARYVLVWCVYIGMVKATRERAHVGVEIFINILPKVGQKVVRILADVITLATYIWVFYLSITWISGCMGPNPQLTPLTRIPYWIMYSSIAVGFGLSAVRQLQLIVVEHFLTKEKTVDESANEEVAK